MKKYSVLLLYPDYKSDGTETFYHFVRAKNPRDAVKLSAVAACRFNEWKVGTDINDLSDFAPLLVTRGWNLGEDPEEGQTR